jgi:hypothetical protein
MIVDMRIYEAGGKTPEETGILVVGMALDG